MRDAHSIELEMAAELGLVGLLAFRLLAGGVGSPARAALRREPEVAAGAAAATLVWFLHASIDWDWQLPAVTPARRRPRGRADHRRRRRQRVQPRAARPAPAAPSPDRARRVTP